MLLAVVQEQVVISSKRKAGELVPLPLNTSGHKAARVPRAGRPRVGKRVGRHGLLTPGEASNLRRPEQAVLRRDCTAPGKLRIAQAIEDAGVKEAKDLTRILPETWRQLTLRYGRLSPS